MCKRKLLFLLVSFTLGIIMVNGPFYNANTVSAQESALYEMVLRSGLTSTTPVYAEGHEGDENFIIGFNTTSDAFLITTGMPNGVVPQPSVDLGDPVGTAVSEIRLPEGTFVDTSSSIQIASGTATLTTPGGSLSYTGTVIIRWVHDDQGNYQGTRWTDFSMGITDATGQFAGLAGHVVGTRFLVGTPITFQSGIMILRFRLPL
jgi:hypothetical protein